MNSIKVILLLVELTTVVYGLRCYKCNSANQPYCDSPFDPPDFGPQASVYTEDCDEKIMSIVKNDSLSSLASGIDRIPGLGWASICRKVVQKVEGRETIFRSCGWYHAASEDPGCYKKIGSLGLTSLICSCRGDLCNSAINQQSNLLVTAFSSLTLVMITVILRM